MKSRSRNLSGMKASQAQASGMMGLSEADFDRVEAEKDKKNDSKMNDDKMVISKAEYEKLLASAAEKNDLQDKFLRAHAEFENAKKRIEKDKIDYLRFANDSFLLEFLPILDSLEIAALIEN